MQGLVFFPAEVTRMDFRCVALFSVLFFIEHISEWRFLLLTAGYQN